MAELRLHHTYARGAAVDVSDNGNHGKITRAYPTSSGSALEFTSPNSRVQVSPSDSLKRFRSFRARVRFRLDPDASDDRRYNLMEGHLSFALYVTPDFTLTGTIYDNDRNWRGPTSDPGVVEPGRWHTAELTYVDSAARVELRLDGERVGAKQGVAGPVRPVGDLGVAIGIWPDADRYTLDGQLDDVKIWATWPEFEDFVDPCCADTGALDRIVDVVRRDPAVQNREVDPTAILRELQAISARVRAAIVDDDPERAEQVKRLEREFEDAYQERDLRRMLTTCARGYQLMLSAGVSSTAMVDEGKKGIDLLRRVKLGRQLLDPFLEMDIDGPATRSTLTRVDRRRPPPDPPAEVIGTLGDAARALCFPAPTGEKQLPSTDSERNWGRIPHEPWPERPDRDPGEFEQERKGQDDRGPDSAGRDTGDSDEGNGDGGDSDPREHDSKESDSEERDSKERDSEERESKAVDSTEGAAKDRESKTDGQTKRQPEKRRERGETDSPSDARQSDHRQSDVRQSSDDESATEESDESTAASGDDEDESEADGGDDGPDTSTEDEP